MKFIKKILIAQDFGKHSEEVLDAAIYFASVFHSEVAPIHVLPDDMVNEKVKVLLSNAVQKKLDESITHLKRKSIKVDNPLLVFGSPSTVIVKAAVDNEANLIIAGSGEKKIGDHFLLGSTTKRIIQKSNKPVLVVKAGSELRVKHILCPIDFSPTSKTALENAISLARLLNAQVTVLSVCESHSLTWFASEKSLILENQSRRKRHEENFNEFLSDFDLSNLKSETEIQFGDPSAEILKTISKKKVDLLLIGTSGRSGVSRLIIGSVTEKVVREVPCSFMTLKSEDLVSSALEENLRDIEKHFTLAEKYVNAGLTKEAIRQFNICLTINNMHVPSHYGLAKIYENLKDHESARMHRKRGSEILDRTWDKKIEEGAWKFKSC